MRTLNDLPLRYRAYRHCRGKVEVFTVETVEFRRAEREWPSVFLRPRYVGICSADVREIRGERPGRKDFGHEVVGTVIESTHPGFISGDSVILNPFEKVERETAYAEMMYLAGPEHVLGDALIKVPSTDLHYAITEPLACIIHAARQSGANGAESALVVGAGFFGFLLYCYLEHLDVPVTLTNRSPDRLRHLVSCVPGLRAALDLWDYDGRFGTAFLMQSHIESEHIEATARVIRENGEVVLFGAIDREKHPELQALRNGQRRAPHQSSGKNVYLQGTLDATPADLEEAIRLLGQPEFVRRLLPIFAPPLSFEQGVDHLNDRARTPRNNRKYMVDMGEGCA